VHLEAGRCVSLAAHVAHGICMIQVIRHSRMSPAGSSMCNCSSCQCSR
jgi:hypothetical protein